MWHLALHIHAALLLSLYMVANRPLHSHIHAPLLQALSNFTHEIAICEYGLKALSFVAYVAVAVSNTDDAGVRNGDKKVCMCV